MYRERLFLPEIIREGFGEEVEFAVTLEGRIALGSGRLGCVGREQQANRHGYGKG